MQRWLMLTLAAIPVLFSVSRPSPPLLQLWVTHGLEKVRPYDRTPETLKQKVELVAARNEFEPFQIVFHAEANEVQGIDVDISDLKGPHGASISRDNISIYFERLLDLPRPSSIEGAAGEWPDPLIPRVDRYFNERRNSFPFNLPRRRNQPIWVEVYVPAESPSGAYHGTATVLVKQDKAAAIPITLNVGNFAIPSTSSLPNTFGFNGIGAVRQHLGKYTNDTDVRRFTSLYRRAALAHRISVHGGAMIPPPFEIRSDHAEIDWKTYDQEIGPFLDGTIFTAGEPLAGAKATAIDLPTHRGLQTDEQKVLYWRAFARHFKEKGWFSRLFNYLWDEPKPESYEALLHRGRLVHMADPELQNLVTAPLKQQWTDVIDIWVPLVNCFASKPGFRNFCEEMVPRNAYQAELDKGQKLWWYQSCGSHGCNIVGGEYFTGWPSYVIDSAAVANRIMPWLAWKYSIGGELYFNLDEAFSRNRDAWNDVYLFGGNGDGTLVYPGRAATIGGKTDIPIESIRLKLIREGLEDYEYLALLAKLAGYQTASNLVDRLVTNAYTYKRDPAALYEIRRELWDRLNKLAAPTDN